MPGLSSLTLDFCNEQLGGGEYSGGISSQCDHDLYSLERFLKDEMSAKMGKASIFQYLSY